MFAKTPFLVILVLAIFCLLPCLSSTQVNSNISDDNGIIKKASLASQNCHLKNKLDAVLCEEAFGMEVLEDGELVAEQEKVAQTSVNKVAHNATTKRKKPAFNIFQKKHKLCKIKARGHGTKGKKTKRAPFPPTTFPDVGTIRDIDFKARYTPYLNISLFCFYSFFCVLNCV